MSTCLPVSLNSPCLPVYYSSIIALHGSVNAQNVAKPLPAKPAIFTYATLPGKSLLFFDLHPFFAPCYNLGRASRSPLLVTLAESVDKAFSSTSGAHVERIEVCSKRL